MGLEGIINIVYEEINRFRDARGYREKQKEIAKQMVKKALLQFNFEWDSSRKSGKKGNWRSTADSMLEGYAKLFIFVTVEINEAVTEEDINELCELATELRKTVNIPHIQGIGDDYKSMGDECAIKAKELSRKFGAK